MSQVSCHRKRKNGKERRGTTGEGEGIASEIFNKKGEGREKKKMKLICAKRLWDADTDTPRWEIFFCVVLFVPMLYTL